MKWIPFECSEEIPEENFTSLKNSYNHCTTNLCRKKKTRNSVATNNIWKFIHTTDYEKVLPRGMVNSSCGSSRGEMAATTAVKSPLHTSSLHKPTTSFSCCSKVSFSAVRLPARRRSCSISSSAGETNADVNAIEVRKVADEDLKVSATLPRPLTSAHFSNASTSEGSRLRVAYQGVSGAYSESAAEKAYPNCEAVSCEQFDTAFEAVERWTVDRAVLPIENSLGGSIHRNYDLLLRHRLHIVGEVKLAIRHCLMANHGAKIEDLHRVLSHPQALAQCENTLTKWGLVREAVDDTAGAAQYIAFEGIKDAGAVASETAAKIYGLNILARDIQDDSDNVTRFLMLAREPIIPGVNKPFKTSIVFSLEEGPGVLFKALAVFAMRSINLTKIESRPLQKQALQDLVPSTSGLPKNFPYIFYVDFEASMADQRAQNALGHLKEFAAFLRVLGSYPADNGMP